MELSYATKEGKRVRRNTESETLVMDVSWVTVPEQG